jgi:phosphohistidine phosphatase
MEKFVVFLRHGIAEPHGSGPDEDRALTDIGKKRMAEIAHGLHDIFPKVKLVVSSPLKRAMQTAEYVAKVYRLNVETHESLRPGADFSALIRDTPARRFIVVGHEPTMSSTMLRLTHMSGSLELKKGGCYGVRVLENGDAQLEWMLPPRVMR